MKALRLSCALAIAAAYATAIAGAAHPAATALGLAPLAWIALEAAWRLFAPRD